jgi:hypothetical protein
MVRVEIDARVGVAFIGCRSHPSLLSPLSLGASVPWQVGFPPADEHPDRPD